MVKGAYQIMADGARDITKKTINRELRDMFKQIRSAAEKGYYSVDIDDTHFDNRYKRRLQEMGYNLYSDKYTKTVRISW